MLVCWAVLTSWSWLIWRIFTGQPILPAKPLFRQRAVPWHLGTILLAFVLYASVSLFATASYPVVAVAMPGKSRPIPWSHLMLLNGSVTVIMLILIPWLVRKTSGGRLLDFGLSLDGWWRQLIHGLVATFIAAPVIYMIQFGAEKIWKRSEHPLSKMISEEFSVGVGWLAIVTAVVLAPLFEELVFRGLLQSWLVAWAEGRSSLLRRSPGKEPLSPDLAGDVSLAGDQDVEKKQQAQHLQQSPPATTCSTRRAVTGPALS